MAIRRTLSVCAKEVRKSSQRIFFMLTLQSNCRMTLQVMRRRIFFTMRGTPPRKPDRLFDPRATLKSVTFFHG
jgi:hypothetical protein